MRWNSRRHEIRAAHALFGQAVERLAGRPPVAIAAQMVGAPRAYRDDEDIHAVVAQAVSLCVLFLRRLTVSPRSSMVLLRKLTACATSSASFQRNDLSGFKGFDRRVSDFCCGEPVFSAGFDLFARNFGV